VGKRPLGIVTGSSGWRMEDPTRWWYYQSKTRTHGPTRNPVLGGIIIDGPPHLQGDINIEGLCLG